MAGRTVLVTGASEGIGAATARHLAAAGARVLLVARNTERLERIRSEITAAGGLAEVHAADLSSPAAAAALGHELLARYRRIDVVVSNAGRSIRRSVADTADRFHDIERTANLNYLGPVQLLLVLLPAMRACGGGHVVNVSTAGLSMPGPHWSAYHASKAAFDTWLRTAAVELRRDAVTVSTVYCNLVRTRMIEPTVHYRRMPAMSADEAAGIVCRAIAHRRSWWPWWARVGAVLAAALPSTVGRALSAGLWVVGATEPLRVSAAAGLWRPYRLMRLLRAGRLYGTNLAAAVAAGPPDGVAIVDQDGSMTYADLEAASRRCARAAAAAGIGPGDRVGVACRGHRGFVIATVGLSRLGTDVVLLPPTLPDAPMARLVTQQRISALVTDPGGPTAAVPSIAWPALMTDAEPRQARTTRAGRPGAMHVLTSGTTGTPRSVSRRFPLRMLVGPVTTHLRLTPLHRGEAIVVAAPPHHGYGLTYLAAGLVLGTPVVLVNGGDPAVILRAVAKHRAVMLCALPIQLRRICELPARQRPTTDSLRAVVSGSAPLSADLCARLREIFGDRVLNMYATTEAGWVTIASPADLRAAPGTVGRPPRGIGLRIVDADGIPLPPGHVGEVSVRGWHPDRNRWMATGDLGHLDPAGRLFLDGRLDDMIVSGGENAYPGPVLRALTSHPDVVDAVVEAVPDHEFGQRFAATVEVRPGSPLTAADLLAWLRDRLATAERPRDIAVVESLARTPTGKPRRPDPGPPSSEPR